MKRLLILLAALGIALASGCKSGDKETLWGTYQEPMAPQTLPAPAGMSELSVLWRKSLGAGAQSGYAILKPVYAGGGVYAASRNGNVFKLNPEDGSTVWRRDLGASIFSGVDADHEMVVAALDDGAIVALDAATGEVRWESPINRQISAIPVVGGGRVVARTAGGLVAGLDAADGKTVWSFEREAPPLSIHGDSTPLISGDAVFIGLANGKLLANSVVTGREYWETEVSFAKGRNELERMTDSDTEPLVAGDTIYTATYQGNVAALRLQDAALQWKTKISSRLPMSLANGRLLVTGELGEVVALDAESGDILWMQESFRGHGMSPPLVVEDRVLVGDARGNIYSLDASDGALLETRRAVNGAVVALVAWDDRFVVFSSQGNISALALRVAEN